MKNIYKLSLLLLICFLIIHKNTFAQFNENPMFINNNYRILDIDSKFFLGSETVYDNEKNVVYITWTVINDNVPGTYLVFKSFNFTNYVPIGTKKTEMVYPPNKPIRLTVKDDKYSPEYNFYHIVKIDNASQSFFNYDMIRFNALNNIYILEKENKNNDVATLKSSY